MLAWIALAVLAHTAITISADAAQTAGRSTNPAIKVPRHLCLAAMFVVYKRGESVINLRG